ncbi:MAG: hypothetical protein HY427_03685 [Candidatus Levybacteria bacterium]|nr:hypothetical protein [Candidatus Levybacteria bacterium]
MVIFNPIKFRKKKKKESADLMGFEPPVSKEPIMTPVSSADFLPPKQEVATDISKPKFGFIKKDDKQFALPKKEILNLEAQGDIPAGALEAQQLARQKNETQVFSEDLLNQIGKLTPEQQARKIQDDKGLTTAQAGIAGLGGAITGAGAGFAVAGPPGAAVGALVGGIGAAYAAVAYDKTQDVKTAKTAGIQASNNIDITTNALNAGLISPSEALDRINNEISNLYASQRTLQQETRGAVGRDLSKAQDELIQITSKVDNLEYQKAKLRLALLQPNPVNIIPIQQDIIQQ